MSPALARYLEERATLLWDSAYDSLKSEKPEVVNTYELILSHFMAKKGQFESVFSRRLEIELSHNDVEQFDHSSRQGQMRNLVGLWLADAVQNNSDTMYQGNDGSHREISAYQTEDDTQSLMATILMAAHETPQASLVWVASCLAIEAS